VGEVLQRIQGSRWFNSYAQKFTVIAFPVAIVLSIIPMIIGLFAPQIASVYLISAYVLVFLTIFGVCIILLGFHNQVARRLAIIVAVTSFFGALGYFWLLIEVFFLGLPFTFPNISVYLLAIANIVLLVGFALISVGQRRRSWRQFAGYFLITVFFVACIYSTYQLVLVYIPPPIPAIGLGLRILAGFFTAVFAWAFYFNQNPPKEIISQLSRSLFVAASLLLLLGYTLFSFQYAMGWFDFASFYYTGSLGDSVILLAIFTFLIAVFAIFSESLENMATIRPVSIKYEIVSRVLIIISFLIVTTLTATIAITLTGRVLLVYLTPPHSTVALQTIGSGLLMGLGIILIVGGGIAYYLSRILYRPLERLDEETSLVSEPGKIAYTEPPGLLFTELQDVSDNFASLVDGLGRVRDELRRFTISERRLRTPSTSQLSRLDYYLAILSNTVTNRIQSILSLTELGCGKETVEEQKQILEMIQTEVAEIEYIMKSIQLLRLIDSEALPDFTRIDVCEVIPQLMADLQELIPESQSQISLALPEHKCQVMANEYVNQIFKPLLRLAIEQDVGGPATIEVTFSNTTEFGVDYWQIDIVHPKWVLPDIEKVLLFRSDPEQPQKANPGLLLVPALVEYFRGKFRVTNVVTDDPRYGTVFHVLLPMFKRKREKSIPKSTVEE